jgi:hypothetical protein
MRVFKGLIILTFIFSAGISFAESYRLVTDKHCKNRGVELGFTCENRNPLAPNALTITRLPANEWIGDERGNKFALEFVKEDSNVLVLNYPVLYSGIANVVLVKATGSFYFTEIGYSPALQEQSYDVESGNFFLVE